MHSTQRFPVHCLDGFSVLSLIHCYINWPLQQEPWLLDTKLEVRPQNNLINLLPGRIRIGLLLVCHLYFWVWLFFFPLPSSKKIRVSWQETCNKGIVGKESSMKWTVHIHSSSSETPTVTFFYISWQKSWTPGQLEHVAEQLLSSCLFVCLQRACTYVATHVT